MIFEFGDYRKYMKSVVLQKQKRSPKFSLRSIAKQLGLAPSTFSEVLNGKKNLSFETALSVATKLGLKNKEADYFCLLVKLDSAKDEDVKVTIQKKIEALNPRGPVYNLSTDLFSLVADWHHLALLSTLTLDNVRKEPADLAHALGLDKFEVEEALDRLERLKLIKKDEEGQWARATSDLFVGTEIPHKGLHRYHQQMLQKAIESIEGQKFSERIIRTENMAIDESQLSLADEYIEEFFTKMSSLTKKAKRKNHIYHLGTQFFRLTRNGEKK